MTFLSFLGNSVDTLGNVFSNFFSDILFNVIAPIMLLLFLVIFLAINYFAVKGHIWLLQTAYKYFMFVMGFLQQKEKDFLDKFVK